MERRESEPDPINQGPCESAELQGLKYVAQHTPVPKVHRTYSIDGRLYIEMEYIHGVTLQELWTSHSLSPTEKQAIVKQVAACINELRLLKPPQEGVVASAELGRVDDARVGYRSFGPFGNINDFHSFLRGPIPLKDCTKVLSESVPQCHTRQYRTYFTHADLCPRNIIIRDDKIAAIVDWQFAGWYPEYWEYTKAHYGLLNIPDWYSEFKNAVPRYDDELATERALWAQLDQPGTWQ
ncbi:kinase-like domain-containing protein [Aspergillus minisclerotigenes]|uniref:Kinase-like domain-containing protein n=1 Tax=Aspergillus minisclerotigenes TaxID=656917 RepID=A0A5N6JFF2_9EURO|nr:kinase-like domain-containing protein [Aspergillus minisclerotigenes]